MRITLQIYQVSFMVIYLSYLTYLTQKYQISCLHTVFFLNLTYLKKIYYFFFIKKSPYLENGSFLNQVKKVQTVYYNRNRFLLVDQYLITIVCLYRLRLMIILSNICNISILILHFQVFFISTARQLLPSIYNDFLIHLNLNLLAIVTNLNIQIINTLNNDQFCYFSISTAQYNMKYNILKTNQKLHVKIMMDDKNENINLKVNSHRFMCCQDKEFLRQPLVNYFRHKQDIIIQNILRISIILTVLQPFQIFQERLLLNIYSYMYVNMLQKQMFKIQIYHQKSFNLKFFIPFVLKELTTFFQQNSNLEKEPKNLHTITVLQNYQFYFCFSQKNQLIQQNKYFLICLNFFDRIYPHNMVYSYNQTPQIIFYSIFKEQIIQDKTTQKLKIHHHNILNLELCYNFQALIQRELNYQQFNECRYILNKIYFCKILTHVS
ncbi:hypothetical protein ABPG74_010503 [Tetrahymena malaccensis]